MAFFLALFKIQLQHTLLQLSLFTECELCNRHIALAKAGLKEEQQASNH
jgi:hypothetical protein